ncbi:MAG: hypothetical protein GF368_03165 [Candidatus Aenigmarchaeota archaeon]|nr:hypothetical protein [Candidatus Aenigmarchaeota archaeon]
MLKQKQSNIMSYTDLSAMTTVFDVELKKRDKQRFLGKKKEKSYRKIKPSKKNDQPVSKGKESSDNGFLGIFISMISGLLILLGIILIAVGTTYNPLKEKVDNKDRYCPRCGRSIPFDAVVCPYCKYDFDNTA